MDAAKAERQEAFENLVQAMDEYAVDGVIRRYHIKQVIPWFCTEIISSQWF